MPIFLKVYIFVLPFSELYVNEVTYCISFFSLKIFEKFVNFVICSCGSFVLLYSISFYKYIIVCPFHW